MDMYAIAVGAAERLRKERDEARAEIDMLRSIVRSCRDHIARGTPLNWTGDELTAMRRAEDERQPDKSGLRK